MTKKEFGETMQMIAFAYRQNSLLEKDVLNTWFKFLGNYASSVFQDAAECWIRENSKCPAISDLHELCRPKQWKYEEELEKAELLTEEQADELWEAFCKECDEENKKHGC